MFYLSCAFSAYQTDLDDGYNKKLLPDYKTIDEVH